MDNPYLWIPVIQFLDFLDVLSLRSTNKGFKNMVYNYYKGPFSVKDNPKIVNNMFKQSCHIRKLNNILVQWVKQTRTYTPVDICHDIEEFDYSRDDWIDHLRGFTKESHQLEALDDVQKDQKDQENYSITKVYIPLIITNKPYYRTVEIGYQSYCKNTVCLFFNYESIYDFVRNIKLYTLPSNCTLTIYWSSNRTELAQSTYNDQHKCHYFPELQDVCLRHTWFSPISINVPVEYYDNLKITIEGVMLPTIDSIGYHSTTHIPRQKRFIVNNPTNTVASVSYEELGFVE
jgi:hypothetical protein